MKQLRYLTLCSLFALVICVQASRDIALRKEYTNQEIQARTSIDQIMSLMDKVEIYIERPLQKAIGFLIYLYKRPKDMAFGFITKFEKILQNKTKILINLIIAPTMQASILGVNISGCIANNIDAISAIPVHILNFTTFCVRTKIQEAEDIILGTINNLNASYDKIKTLLNELKECKEKFIIKKAICIPTLTVKVGLALAGIPTEITTAIAKATEYIVNFQQSLTTCTVGQLSNLGIQGGAIVTDVIFCCLSGFPQLLPLFKRFDTDDTMRWVPGVNISGCIGNNIEAISAIPVQILNLTTACIRRKIQEAEDIILGSINNMNASYDKTKTLLRELKDCKDKSMIMKAVCVPTVTVKASLALAGIPTEITKAIAKATAYIVNFQQSLTTCTVGQLSNLGIQGGTIVKDVIFCCLSGFPKLFPLFRRFDMDGTMRWVPGWNEGPPSHSDKIRTYSLLVLFVCFIPFMH